MPVVPIARALQFCSQDRIMKGGFLGGANLIVSCRLY